MVKRTYARSSSTTRITKRRTMPMRSRQKSKSTKDELERLSRLVTKNTRLSQGAIQRNCQTLNVPLIPTDQSPVCFQADNFLVIDSATAPVPSTVLTDTSAARVYQPTFGDELDAYTPGSTDAVAYFTTAKVNLIKSLGYNAPDGTSYNSSYWLNANKDIPDTGKYVALYADYRIRFFTNYDGTVTATAPRPVDSSCPKSRFRVDFVRLKKPLPQALNGTGPFSTASVGTQLMLPGTLASLGELLTVNMYNPDYFSVIKSQDITLEPTRGTTRTDHTITVHLDLGGKTVNQGETVNNFNPVNTDPLKNVWCIISATQTSPSVHDVTSLHWACDITRHCVWRDTMGSSSL